MTTTATLHADPATAPVRVVLVSRSFTILGYTEQEARNAGTVTARRDERVSVERVDGPFGEGLWRWRVTLDKEA